MAQQGGRAMTFGKAGDFTNAWRVFSLFSREFPNECFRIWSTGRMTGWQDQVLLDFIRRKKKEKEGSARVIYALVFFLLGFQCILNKDP